MAGPLSRFRDVTALADIVRGTPGPDTIAVGDDLDAIATFAPNGADPRVTIGALILDIRGAPMNADSFADLVANPATQIFASDDAFA